MKNVFFGSVLLSCLLIACAPTAAPLPPPPPILGAWEMAEVHWTNADTTYSIPAAQPGLVLLTPDRYALMWTRTETPRTPFAVLSAPTDEEIKAGFQSVVFNGGSYVLTDSTLTTTASIAKVPGFEGGQQFYRYQIDGDRMTLTMFDETYPDGTKPAWSGVWQTRFVLRRAE